MFPNKDTPCGWENEVIQERSRDVPDVVNKKETAFSFNLYKILDVLQGCQMLRQYQTIGEIFFSLHAKLHWKRRRRLLVCSANAWIGTNITFLVIPKRCCHFSVVQSFQFEFTTHLMYLQGKHSRSFDQKYNYRECWCYIIHIKQCFPRTNQWLLLHVLAICL